MAGDRLPNITSTISLFNTSWTDLCRWLFDWWARWWDGFVGWSDGLAWWCDGFAVFSWGLVVWCGFTVWCNELAGWCWELGGGGGCTSEVDITVPKDSRDAAHLPHTLETQMQQFLLLIKNILCSLIAHPKKLKRILREQEKQVPYSMAIENLSMSFVSNTCVWEQQEWNKTETDEIFSRKEWTRKEAVKTRRN